ncbi:hypothetical protein [uncultured Prevotella sp.]|uniref:hypothetical protein n=1 Tax=uncultured Prevotella sp. TaxID=159272 RepID=UPI0027E24E0B|nr:hypothetical protein [uncultured Prevotella sp.]
MMKQNNKKKRILNFIQELSWITENYKDITIKDIYRQLQDSNDNGMTAGKLKADTKYLVGVLPTIFQDIELFPKKEDILDFAKQELGIELNIQSKRSKIEYIGSILCKVSKENSGKLEQLVETLDMLLNNESKMAELKRHRQEPNFSWNETIAKLRNI